MKFEKLRLEGWWKKHNVIKGAKFNSRLMLYCLETISEYFKGKNCLELGCADGLWTENLLEKFNRIVAVDGDKEMISEIKKRLNSKKLEVVYSKFEKYSPKEKFNTIIMAHILEHVEDPVFIFQKAKKWLEKDGVMLICVPNADSLHRQAGVEMGLLKKVNGLNDLDNKLGHRRVYTWESLRKDIKKSGLKIKKMGGVFLKPLTHSQIEKWWTEEMISAFFELGKKYPKIAAEIWAVCEK